MHSRLHGRLAAPSLHQRTDRTEDSEFQRTQTKSKKRKRLTAEEVQQSL